MKKIIALLLLNIIVLASCGGGGSNSSKTLTSISVSPANNVIAPGTTRQFTATGTYSDNSTQNITTLVTWNSSNISVATINSANGMVTTTGAGTSSITATSGTIQGAASLTVPAHSLVSISVTPATPDIAPGTNQQFVATGTYLDGSTQDLTASAAWSSSSTTVATIDASTGKATANIAGTTTITAAFGGKSGSANLKVTNLQSIAITTTSSSIAAGTVQQFTATGTLSDSTTQNLTSFVTWSSFPTTVATIDATGKATAVSAGTATITAALGGIQGTFTLTVNPATVQSITVTPATPSSAVGSTQQFTATGTLSDSTTQDLTAAVVWNSSPTSVATIDATGKVTTVGTGTATITATLGGISGSTTLTVTPVSVTGTWTGTYTVYDSVDPTQIGTYTFKFVLTQSGTSVTGTATLRDAASQAVSNTFSGTVTGQQMKIVFTYYSPQNLNYLLTDIGTATIAGGTMTGSVIENYNSLYNCSYTFTLTKQ